MSQRVKIIGFHLLGWALFFALVAAFVRGLGQTFSRFWEASFLLFVLVYVALFYGNAFLLLPKLYLRKKYSAYVTAAVLLLLLVYWLKPFDRLVLHSAMGPARPGPVFGDMPPPMPPARRPPPPQSGGDRSAQSLDIVSVVLFIAVWSASSVQQVVAQWRTSERRAAQAEADKVKAELEALKAQINPHFLFNTLNNIYSLAIIKSEKTADAVLTLSAILRYLTDEVRQNFVPLQSEVDCAKAYIKLQQLRLTKKASLDFVVDGQIEGKRIAPLVFMTFIENAFKYGISSHEPCLITVRINAGDRSIHFFCRNRIFPREPESDRESLGLANAQKRLNYLYPEKYLLNIDTQNETFTVDLTVIT